MVEPQSATRRRLAGWCGVSAAHERASAVVVVSALSGVTDRLFNLAAAAAATDEKIVLAGLGELQQRHEQVARQVVPDADAL